MVLHRLEVIQFVILLVQKYHPSRVLTLVYQPFAVGTLAVLAYNEAKLNTRIRNMFGYILFFISTLLVLIVSPTEFRTCIIDSSRMVLIYFLPI